MPHPFSDPVYSLESAGEAVSNFYNSYARACNFVAKKCEIDVIQLIEGLEKRFMYNNRKWNKTRDLIKAIENENLYGSLAWTTKAAFIKFMKTRSLPVE